MISTDLDLAAKICPDVGRAYAEAVEFTRVLPSYALVRYRDALDCICDRIAERNGLRFDSQSVFDKINALNHGSAITFGFKDRCHQLRKLCNPGAHRSSLISADKKVDELKDELAQLEANALEARELMLWVLESMYKIVFPEAVVNYSRASIDTQDWKDLLFRATTVEDSVLKYKAGLWCEAEAHKRELNFKGFIASNEFEVDQAFFKRLAATFFYASFKLFPNIDAGFRYAKFVEQGKIDGHNVDEARLLIEQAAKAGHGEACDNYAVILYKDKNDYPEAERYWQLAAQNDVTRAYYCLSVFYTEGKACSPQPEKAKEFLEKGVEQDCRNCLYALGRAYFEGEWLPKNVDKSRELLLKAGNLGHGIARGYLDLVVNDGAAAIAEELAKFGRRIAATISPDRQIDDAKRDPYSLCNCGSGNKFKWCCMPKLKGEAVARSPLAQYIPHRK